MDDLKFDFFSITTIIGIFFSLFLALIIAKIKKANRKANIIFSIFLINVSVTLFGLGILTKTNLYLYLPHLLNISTPSILLLGPLYLFYIKTLITGNFNFNKFTILHFIPFIVLLVIFIPFYIKSGQYKIQYLQSLLNNSRNLSTIKQYLSYFFVHIHIFAYLCYSLHIINNYEKAIKNSYSLLDKINIKWLKYFIYLFFLLVITLIIILILMFFILKYSQTYMFIPVVVTFVICFLAYRALIQPEILTDIELKDLNKKNKKAPTNLTDIDNYITLIEDAMKNNKLYMEPDLSLTTLASKLNLNRNQLSFVINNHYNMNFYDFINQYRVNEVKSFLIENKTKNFNIINVAMNAGFNSKSTFNAIFKKHTKMTPTEFMKKY